MIIRNILILIKYFHICVAMTSCYKLTNSAAMNYFLCGFTGVFWCAGMICFLCSTNIQHIILPADNQRHALVNKHPDVGRCRPCTDGPLYILLSATLATPLAGYEKRHARGAQSYTLDPRFKYP